jgi:hypothetical protein
MLLAAAFAFGPIQAVAAADATAFQAQCISCHPRAAILARRLDGGSTVERSAALAEFLKTHHGEDGQTRAAIVDYLVELSSQ